MLALIALFAVQQPGPVLPVGTAPHLTALSLDVQRALSTGDFGLAEKRLTDWPSGKLSYSVSGLPEKYRDADDQAASLIEEAMGGRIDLAEGENPRLVFRFVPMPAEGPPEPEWKDGKVMMAVPITDRSAADSNARAVAWSLAKGMAYLAGLDSTTKRRHIMGPVPYVRSVADPVVSIREQSLLSQIEDVRAALAAAVKSKTKLVPAEPKVVVQPATVDLGRMVQGDLKEFEFTIRNDGNAPANIEIETTCSCIIAKSMLVVAAGESIVMKPKFDSADYQGDLEKHLYVLSNSPSAPRATLVMKGSIMPEVRFLAPKGSRSVHNMTEDGDVAEVEIPETGKGTLELMFFGTVQPVELLDIQLGSPLATALTEAFQGNVDDPLLGSGIRSGTKVNLELSAKWPFGVSWLRIVGVTNSKRRPSVEMTLQVRRGISVSPQSFYFGDARVGETVERTAMIEHGSKPFKITKVEGSTGVTAKFETVDGSDRRYNLTVRVSPALAGPISGTVTVHTDSLSQPTIVVPVGGQAG